MANSKLLKQAIADAKAVKETALANAKIALEEAFTPRLQSILSQKLRAEAEEGDEEAANVQEELDSSDIGSKVGTNAAVNPGKQPSLDADTDLSVGVKKSGAASGAEVSDYKKVKDISEEENPFGNDMESDKQSEIEELRARLAELEGEDEDEMNMSDEYSMDNDMEGEGEDYDVTGSEEEVNDEEDYSDEDEMDLESIIRELELSMADGEESETEEGMYEEDEMDAKNENLADGSEAGTDKGADPKVVATNEEEGKEDDVIDLEEILREMEADMSGMGDDKEKANEEEDKKEMEKALNEAYKTIKSLQKTINEVNLLNAKLLFANKLFRAHNMTNEQKVKVIETLDRTKSVREVKLVFSTLAENFKYSSSNKSVKKSITEGIASKVVKSTKPASAQKQVISENADLSNRFKKLAGIIK